MLYWAPPVPHCSAGEWDEQVPATTRRPCIRGLTFKINWIQDTFFCMPSPGKAKTKRRNFFILSRQAKDRKVKDHNWR
jgi:hypothetical protein